MESEFGQDIVKCLNESVGQNIHKVEFEVDWDDAPPELNRNFVVDVDFEDVDINDDDAVLEFLCDWLSDEYGFTHSGFTYNFVEPKNEIYECVSEERLDEGKISSALAALVLGATTAFAEPSSFIKEVEGSVKKDGNHVVYDDATKKAISKVHYCPKCKKFVKDKNSDGKCDKCETKLELRYNPKGTATIGYGDTSSENVDKGKISEEEAIHILKEKLKSYGETVDSVITVKLTENQRDALVSFCYNVGKSAFKNSTLVKKINAGASDDEIKTEFRKWIKNKGKDSNGLKNRREREIELYFKQ